MTFRQRLIAFALATFAVASVFLVVVSSPASAADAMVPVTTTCTTGWYVNNDGDETKMEPTQRPDGLHFSGPSIVHHAITPVIKLANLQPGSIDATGDTLLFKVETALPYSTLNYVGGNKWWSSTISAANDGGQDKPQLLSWFNGVTPDLHPTWGTYGSDTTVVSFGTGFGHDVGFDAVVMSITFGATYSFLPCPPPTTAPTTPAATPVTHPTTHAPSSSTQTGGRSTTGRGRTTVANNDTVYPLISVSPSASEEAILPAPTDSTSPSPVESYPPQAIDEPAMTKTSHTGLKLAGLGGIAFGIVMLAMAFVLRRNKPSGSNDDTQHLPRH